MVPGSEFVPALGNQEASRQGWSSDPTVPRSKRGGRGSGEEDGQGHDVITEKETSFLHLKPLGGLQALVPSTYRTARFPESIWSPTKV